MHSRFNRRTLPLAVAVMLGLIGCGSSGPKDDGIVRARPKGRILQNGQPVKINTANLPPGDPGLQVIFVKVGTPDAGAEIPAQVTDASTGTFELVGPDGRGIPEGKYRIAVILAPFGSADQFKGKYNQQNSKIERELKAGQDLEIDLDKPNG